MGLDGKYEAMSDVRILHQETNAKKQSLTILTVIFIAMFIGCIAVGLLRYTSPCSWAMAIHRLWAHLVKRINSCNTFPNTCAIILVSHPCFYAFHGCYIVLFNITLYDLTAQQVLQF